MVTIHQRYRRTDRRHAIPRPRICTKVHCAVKIQWSFWNVVLQKAIKKSVDIIQDEWMDSVPIKSWQRTSGPGEINETGILWPYDTEIWKSGEGNGSRMCTRLQKSWMTTPTLDRWYHRMDCDEDQWSGSSSGRSWSLKMERDYAPPTLLMEEGSERRRRWAQCTVVRSK